MGNARRKDSLLAQRALSDFKGRFEEVYSRRNVAVNYGKDAPVKVPNVFPLTSPAPPSWSMWGL
jgi:hypothetical protein